MSSRIREAALEDLELLTRIAHDAKRHWGYPERWIQAWQHELRVTPEELQRLEVFVAEDGKGLVLGFAALRSEGERSELEHLWVDPGAMGGGVGRELFEEAIARARARGSASLEIDSDPHAREFYTHLGAVECGRVEAPMEGIPRVRPQLRYILTSA